MNPKIQNFHHDRDVVKFQLTGSDHRSFNRFQLRSGSDMLIIPCAFIIPVTPDFHKNNSKEISIKHP